LAREAHDEAGRWPAVHIAAAMIPGRLPWAGMNQAFGLVDSALQ
jgi:hypothetical protein